MKLNINCERVLLKRICSVLIAFLFYLLLEECDIINAWLLKYCSPFVVLFIALWGLSYVKFFTVDVEISKENRYILIKKGKFQKKYEHNNQEYIRLIRMGLLSNHIELFISVPGRNIQLVPSIYERNIEDKLKVWDSK